MIDERPDVSPGALPDELASREQWVCWRIEERDGEETKPPIAPYDGQTYASSTDPDTWRSHSDAVAYHERSDTNTDGIGFMLSEEGTIAGFDIDDCRDPEIEEIDEWARELIDALPSYAEVSPSGTGVHVVLFGLVPDGGNRADVGSGHIELYDHARYLTFTGDHIEGTPDEIRRCSSQFREIHQKHVASDSEEAAAGEFDDIGGDESDTSTGEYTNEFGTALETIRERDDKLDQLLSRLEPSYSLPNDDDSASGYDLAAASKLHYWRFSKSDAAAILRQYRGREKIRERDDYLKRTLSEAWGGEQCDPPTSRDEPSGSERSEGNPEEVGRGEAILNQETAPEEPAGELDYGRSGDGFSGYGYHWQKTDDEGNVIKSGFDVISNFTLELLSRVDTYEDEVLHIQVRPEDPTEDPFEVHVPPTVFNEPREFRSEVVRGRTTWFDPGKYPDRKALNELKLTVGRQPAPNYEGTEYIGLHGEEYDEWVTPDGTLTGEGWTANPANVYYEKGGDQRGSSSLSEKWSMSADDGDEFDRDTVREILKRVPKTRDPDRGLPVLGWFYAAPLKPIVMDEEGEFNLLQVAGATGTGKTTTLEMYYQLFGMDASPFGVDDTHFTIQKKLAGSCGLPIWFDEYKPTETASDHINWFHQTLRKASKGYHIPKGRPDLSEITLEARAPIVFSGEQTVNEPAVRRRTVMTQFTRTGKEGEYKSHYAELTGSTKYETDNGEIRNPDGYDLTEHALAYYQYITETDPAKFRRLWERAAETTDNIEKTLGVTPDDAESQGLQTVVFGALVFSDFASEFDVSESALPDDTDIRGAIEHVVENIGPDGRRREHIDDFTELLSQAALADYIEEGKHYRVVESKKFGCKALAFHMQTCHSAVRRFVQEFNVEDEYNLIGKADYVDNFDDKADLPGSYALDTSRKTRGLDNGARAVYIDMERASDVLGSDFSPQAFTDEPADDGEETPLDAIESGDMATVTAEVVQLYSDTKPWYATEGFLVDESTSAVKVVVRDECDLELEEGQHYRFSDVSVRSEQDGILTVEIVPNLTEVEEIDPGEGTTLEESQQSDFLLASSGEDSDQEAAADGGRATDERDQDGDRETPDTQEDTESPSPAELAASAVMYVQQEQRGRDPGVPGAEILKHLQHRGADESAAEHAVKKALQGGDLSEVQEGYYRA